MDLNQPKSVWLRLILPICLGVFATAIYHNAIKTQKVSLSGLVAAKTVEVGEVLDADAWEESFEVQSVIFHSESAAEIKTAFKAKEILAKFSNSQFAANRKIEKGTVVSVFDFRVAR